MRLRNIEIIKKWEGLRLKAYLPTPNDRWTIGYGHTENVYQGLVISEEEAENLLRKDIVWVEKTISDLVKVKLNQNQYDALGSIIFNIGRGNFASSTLLRKLNKGDYEGAANEFPRWKHQKGKVLMGLVNRRAEEKELFLKEVDAPVDNSSTLVGLLRWLLKLLGGK